MILETYTGCADPGNAKHTRLRDLSVLQRISLFASLSPDQFPELANSLNEVELPAQAILFRGADLDVVWPEFLMVVVIGLVFFSLALSRLRRTIGIMQ